MPWRPRRFAVRMDREGQTKPLRPTQKEIDRRYANIRAAMAADHLAALIICGNQYTGFEGAVRYVSGFEIVHRYVYVLLPLSGEPTLVFPREARWIGDKKAPWVRDQVWAEIPGKWLREKIEEKRWKRVGVYGLDFIMAVRDYRELQQGSLELVPFDFQFDMARAVKSEEELAGVRDAMDIILDGFAALLKSYQPSTRTRAMSDVYPEAMEAARLKMHDGVLACDVHKAAADVFERAGFALGHLTGHSIGLTMIEHPAIGANTRIALRENMVCSFHPQVVDQNGQVCLYTQDTYRIGKKEGECLASVPWKFYSGAEVSSRA